MANVTVELPPMSTVAIGFGPMVTGMMLQQLFLGVLSMSIHLFLSYQVPFRLTRHVRFSSRTVL